MTAPDRKEPKVEWIAEPDEVMAALGSWIVREPNSFIVCCVYDNGGRRQHVAEKHARLIASAPALAAEVEALRNENIALQLQWDWLIGELMDRSDTRDSGDRQGPNAEMSMLIDFDQQFPNARNAK